MRPSAKQICCLKKRGCSGMTEETHEMSFTMIELIFAIVFAYLLTVYVVGIAKDTTFQKNFLARDIATTIDAVYASPNEIFYVYPPSPFNFTRYTLELANEKVKIGVKKSDGTDTLYWFADLSGTKLATERLEDMTTIAIAKTKGAKPKIIPLLNQEG
jgi:hypothetical protein